jgi:T-complex protein 1 subunit epsilon
MELYDLDMKKHFVIDPLIGKRQQLLLATQLCRMVLKVCSIFPYLHPNKLANQTSKVNNVIIAGSDDNDF